jgi:lipoate---protein ligase
VEAIPAQGVVTPPWRVERWSGRASAFHGRDLPAERAVWCLSPSAPALVLGSTQLDDVVRAGGGVEVVRRRSGGGAVLLVPGDVAWVDVVLPRDDPLWCDDVGVATYWLGEVWARAVASLGFTGEVHRGALCTSPWSRLVCFAGLGPGEVTVGGRKAVGISQRRNRDLARFQTAAYVRWDPAALVELLEPPRPEPAELDVVAALDRPVDTIVDAFLAALTDPAT